MRLSRPDHRIAELARRVRGVAFGSVALASVLVAGCGSGGSGRAAAKLPALAVATMNTHLANVAAAVGSHDRAGATREIDAFAGDVAQQKAAGHLSSGDYAALVTGIARTRSRIGVEVLAPTPPTPAPVSVGPSQPAAQTQVLTQGASKAKGGGKGDGAKQGKGGKGKGDGGG